MSILQKYILREWLWTFMAVSFLLMIVVLSMFLGEQFNDLADGRMPPGLVVSSLLLYIPEATGDVIPLAGFVSVMWGLGRLYRDQEMAVMRASGFHWQRLVRPLLNLSLPVAALLLVVELVVAPAATAMSEKKLEEAFRTAAVWGLQAGQFHVLQGGDFVIYVEALEDEGQALRKVFIHQRHGAKEQIWLAERGKYWMDPQSGDRYITLEDGQITETVEGQLDVRLLRFRRNDLRMPEPDRRSTTVDLASRPSAELIADGSEASWAELQWRFTPSLMLVVLTFLAVPLAHSEPRESRGSRVILGILSYALYANVLFVCRAWVAEGALPAWLGLWWTHALVLVVGFVWLSRQGRMPRGSAA